MNKTPHQINAIQPGWITKF